MQFGGTSLLDSLNCVVLLFSDFHVTLVSQHGDPEMSLNSEVHQSPQNLVDEEMNSVRLVHLGSGSSQAKSFLEKVQ